MLHWRAILTVMMWMSVADVAGAQRLTETPGTATPQLSGLTTAEANALIEELRDLQRRVRSGESVFFTLLSGAPASYQMTRVAPRDAFLTMVFQNAFRIERVRTDSRLWRPYKLVLAPDGLGRLIWNVEVVLGINGTVERVEMVYEPPAPF